MQIQQGRSSLGIAASTRPVSLDERLPAPTLARNAKMTRSAHAYVRGNTARFYEWLESAERVAIPDGPTIWICGDCHIGNLGPVADVEGNLAIEIRDFDQPVVGNPAHDLVRLGLSLASAARGSNLPGVVTARMVEQLSVGYTDAFSPRQAKRPLTRPATVEQAMRQARRRTWQHLADERVSGATRSIPLGKRFWPVSQVERDGVESFVESDAVRDLVTRLSHREDDAKVRMLDVAYWRKGCSSLGRLRYAVLMDVNNKATRARDFCLLDIKEAVTRRRRRRPTTWRASSAPRMPARWTRRRERHGGKTSWPATPRSSMRRPGCGTAWWTSSLPMSEGTWTIAGGTRWGSADHAAARAAAHSSYTEFGSTEPSRCRDDAPNRSPHHPAGAVRALYDT